MDRDFILKQAKKVILKDGGHIPLVIVVAQEQSYVLPVLSKRWNTDASGREMTLFDLGRAFAQNECLTPNDLKSLYLIHEMWFVKRQEEGEDLFVARPSEHPRRQEGLGVLEMILDPVARKITHTYFMVEVLRRNGSIDLGPYEEIGEKEIRSNLLLRFLAGIASADYDDEEFGKLIERIAEVGEI